MRTFFVSIVAIATLLCGGCNSAKNLTPTLAKQLVQERLKEKEADATTGLTLHIEPGSFFALIMRNRLDSLGDPQGTAKVILDRMLKAGLIEGRVAAYAPTSKLLGLAGPRQEIRMGQLSFDNVQSLLLGETETSAAGKLVWHVDYNVVGQAWTGVAESHGVGQAEFHKQPDGSWTCVAVTL